MTTTFDMESRVDPEYRTAFRDLPVRVLDPSDLPASVAAIRESGAARRAAMAEVPLPSGISTEDHSAAGLDGAPDVAVRAYRPATARQPAPALYYIRGGGMIGGTVEMSDPYCASIADRLGVFVASVEYRLAPERPYPAPLEDCYAGLRWLWRNADEFSLDLRGLRSAEQVQVAGWPPAWRCWPETVGRLVFAISISSSRWLITATQLPAATRSLTDGSGTATPTPSVGAHTSPVEPGGAMCPLTLRHPARMTSAGFLRRTSVSAPSTCSWMRTSTTRTHYDRPGFRSSCTCTRAHSMALRGRYRVPRSRVAGEKMSSPLSDAPSTARERSRCIRQRQLSRSADLDEALRVSSTSTLLIEDERALASFGSPNSTRDRAGRSARHRAVGPRRGGARPKLRSAAPGGADGSARSRFQTHLPSPGLLLRRELFEIKRASTRDQ